jgi:hypothetical protein
MFYKFIRNIMKVVLILTLILIIFLLIRLRFNKLIAETFIAGKGNFFNNFISKQNGGENIVKFCSILRDLDKKTDSTLLIKKINTNLIEKGDNEIKNLVRKIDTLQNDITKIDTKNKKHYKYKTHELGEKQRKLLNEIKTNLKQKEPINLNLM